MLGKETEGNAVITTSDGKIEIESARPLRSIDGYRAMFDLVPPSGESKLINLRVYLEANGQPLTETWQYQWTSPEEGDRELHNAGHLK
jgi:glucans biosynthesis protein